jgi:molybdate transport system substrate-binding protein
MGCALLAASMLLAGCTASSAAPLTVFGAASLATALEQMKAGFENAHPGMTLTISTGSSSALRTQIEEGAPADVFLSADTANPQALVDAGLTDGAATPFATNELTIVVPDGNPSRIASPADLAREDVTIIAATEGVPVTGYATLAVANLAALPGYPHDFAAAYEANVASREDNVGAVTSKIDLGEGDAAIVYVTDAQAAGLETVDIPPEANVVATYAGVVNKSSTSTATAHEFIKWIRSSAGQQILSELGFAPTP